MTLYNCRHAGQEYRITKFDEVMNVESTYLCDLSPDACQCPAFEKRSKCRHIEMLPQFISQNHIGDEWFLDFDRGGWVQMGEEWSVTEPESEPMPPLPEGVTMITLDDPLAVHNAIAEAVGEPEAMISERPKGVFIRRRI